jgi:hypothetical protein
VVVGAPAEEAAGSVAVRNAIRTESPARTDQVQTAEGGGEPGGDVAGVAGRPQRDSERTTRRTINQLTQLGNTVTLSPRENAAWPTDPNTRRPQRTLGTHPCPHPP